MKINTISYQNTFLIIIHFLSVLTVVLPAILKQGNEDYLKVTISVVKKRDRCFHF